MSHQLPPRPSLRHLKETAKDLLKAHQSGNASACSILGRLRQFQGKSNEAILASSVSLADVQFALAMHYGFANWSDLKKHLSERTLWDEVYSGGGYEETDPDPELMRLCLDIRPGKAIDVGAGEGRHALWLASIGWQVDALDVSRMAMQKLQRMAEEKALPVNCVVHAAEDFSYGNDVYHLVISAGAALNFFDETSAQRIIDALGTSLKSGGIIYIAVTTPEDPSYLRHRQKATEVTERSIYSEQYSRWITVYRLADLRALLAGWEVILQNEREVHDHHGTPHVHHMAFIAARKR